MPIITESPQIPGVLIVELKPFADSRGRFVEIFRKEWFPQRNWNILQSNRSESAAGVLRGLHYHHHQVDYWHVIQGQIRAALVDLRRESGAFGVSQMIDMSHEDMLGLFIPIGVAHGFLSLTEATLLYYVDNYYDGADEYGVAWNDPDINLDWPTESPIISPRDANNPRLCDIPIEKLPGK
ncbi:MAG: dTDP-4-dehydrorhamnose 3,5-epimerase family protein [Chloroflexota bacterium]|nr:MAG: dTDP-4-dehydrorhamnose 3,5-epimerase family protein [Chloroflexota bacterium]